MVEHNDAAGSSGPADRVVEHSDTVSDGWERTIEDMKAMASDRRDRGFDVVTVPSGDTTPISPAAGDTDRWGFSHLVPGNKVEPFLDLYEGCEFTDTGVYQHADMGHVFMVTECIDLGSRAVVLIAGAYQMRDAAGLVRAATDKGAMYSHVRTLDRTYIGTFEHDDPAAFFPNPDAYLAREG